MPVRTVASGSCAISRVHTNAIVVLRPVFFEEAAKNVSLEIDLVGCASQAARNVCPETDPVDHAGQAAEEVDSESSSGVSHFVQSAAGHRISPRCAGKNHVTFGFNVGHHFQSFWG